MPFTPLHAATHELADSLQKLRGIAERGLSAASLEQARRQLAAAMSAYFIAKEAVLITALRESDDCAHRAIARRAVELDLEWRQHHRQHLTDWPIQMARANPQRCRLGLLRLIRMVERRLAYQEEILLPVAREAMAQRLTA